MVTIFTVIALVFSAIVLILWEGATDVAAGRMTGGAIAAFVGVAIVATIPRRRQERLEADTMSGVDRSAPVGEGAR